MILFPFDWWYFLYIGSVIRIFHSSKVVFTSELEAEIIYLHIINSPSLKISIWLKSSWK